MKQIHFYLFAAALLLLVFCSGCAFFSTPQERSGVNPKPFNSQASWELQPMGGQIIY